MKRILFFTFFLIFTCGCIAQITVKKDPIEIVVSINSCGSLSRGGDELITNKGYYIIRLYTSNKFDNPILVHLKSREEALVTLKDIMDKWESFEKKDFFEIENVRFIVVMPTNPREEKTLAVTTDKHAGIATLYYKSIKTMYDALTLIDSNKTAQ